MRGNNLGIDKLYKFAIERCSFLMENRNYRKIILSDDDRKVVLTKGYFQGFYEALQMINDQIGIKPDSRDKQLNIQIKEK